jgi:hypothetical protein
MFGNSKQPGSDSQDQADRVEAAREQMDRAFHGPDADWSKAASEYVAANSSS